MGVMWSFVPRSKIRQRKYNCTRRTRRKIRLSRRKLRLRRRLNLRRSQRLKRNWRRQKRNECESFDQSCSQRSEDRPHRRRSWNASRPRRGCGYPRGTPIRNRQHENESRSGYVRGKTVAAKRKRPRPCWLRFIANLAWRRRRVWTQAARLFQESFEKCAASRVSKSVERTNQSR